MGWPTVLPAGRGSGRFQGKRAPPAQQRTGAKQGSRELTHDHEGRRHCGWVSVRGVSGGARARVLVRVRGGDVARRRVLPSPQLGLGHGEAQLSLQKSKRIVSLSVGFSVGCPALLALSNATVPLNTRTHTNIVRVACVRRPRPHTRLTGRLSLPVRSDTRSRERQAWKVRTGKA